jgi:hypothetical protein
MPSAFNALRRLYDNNRFTELLRDPDGVYWLKLRSISRAQQLRQLCQQIGLDYEGIDGRQLLAYIYDRRPDIPVLESFIRELYQAERAKRRAIEDIFKDHPSVLPTVGLVKKVDFFIHDFPFDLKVTYFPGGYLEMLRKAKGLRPELAELKTFCKREGVWFETDKLPGVLFPELLAKVSEHPSPAAREFVAKFKATRVRLIQQTIKDPIPLKIWLYENQGVRRFDAVNRFFVILVDAEHLEESWKLKRNKPLLVNAIHTHLSTMDPVTMRNLRLEFAWGSETYEAYSDILFIIVN